MEDDPVYELDINDLHLILNIINKLTKEGLIASSQMSEVGSVYDKIAQIIEDITLPKDKFS